MKKPRGVRQIFHLCDIVLDRWKQDLKEFKTKLYIWDFNED